MNRTKRVILSSQENRRLHAVRVVLYAYLKDKVYATQLTSIGDEIEERIPIGIRNISPQTLGTSFIEGCVIFRMNNELFLFGVNPKTRCR